jgi:hypothetical protein
MNNYSFEEGSMTSIMNELGRKIDSSYCIKDSMDMQTSPSQTSTKARGNNGKDTIISFKSHILVLIFFKRALYQQH